MPHDEANNVRLNVETFLFFNIACGKSNVPVILGTFFGSGEN